MFMTMGSNMAKLIPQKYNMYYVPNISANMLLFDFGKTKSMADSAKELMNLQDTMLKQVLKM